MRHRARRTERQPLSIDRRIRMMVRCIQRTRARRRARSVICQCCREIDDERNLCGTCERFVCFFCSGLHGPSQERCRRCSDRHRRAGKGDPTT